MAGEDTHLTGLGGNVNLDAVLLSVCCLFPASEARLVAENVHILGLVDRLRTHMSAGVLSMCHHHLSALLCLSYFSSEVCTSLSVTGIYPSSCPCSTASG